MRLSWAETVDDETATTVPAPAVPTSVSLGDVAGVRMPRLSYLPVGAAAAFGELAVLPPLLDDEEDEDDDEEEDEERLDEEDAI